MSDDAGRRRKRPIEELEEEAREENPDPVTEREAFELELMEEGRSAEGETVQLDPLDGSSA